MAQKIPFFELFPKIELSPLLRISLGNAYLTAVEIERDKRWMSLSLCTPVDLGEEKGTLENAIAEYYEFDRVLINQQVLSLKMPPG